jgi:hypothetical protein
VTSALSPQRSDCADPVHALLTRLHDPRGDELGEEGPVDPRAIGDLLGGQTPSVHRGIIPSGGDSGDEASAAGTTG